MPNIREMTPTHARRLIISKQHLDAAPSPTMLDVIRDLGCIQLDPIRKVERTHLLVLWSRLGAYHHDELEKLRWEDRSLFEYWAHAASLVLAEDYPLHATYMQRKRQAEAFQAWLTKHDLRDLHTHMLNRLHDEGSLRTSDFDSEKNTGVTFSGWTNGRAVNRLMNTMWTHGDVLPTARQGNQRIWDIASRVLPQWSLDDAYSEYEASYQAVQRAVRALGVAMGKPDIKYHFTRNRYWHFKEVIQQLLKDDKLLPVTIDGWEGDWFIHTADIPLLERIEAGDWHGCTTLLSPFDNLICDRDRTERIWNFHFRIEIYVPKDKRQYGYYVLPILHDDRLIGRMDMAMDRKIGTLHALSTYAQSDAPADAAPAIRESLHSLAAFLDATAIEFGEKIPAMWQSLCT